MDFVFHTTTKRIREIYVQIYVGITCRCPLYFLIFLQFQISYPSNYPHSQERFVIITKDPKLTSWKQKLDQTIQNAKTPIKLSQLLSDAAESFLSLVGGSNVCILIIFLTFRTTTIWKMKTIYWMMTRRK